MARVRLSTTVDSDLLSRARALAVDGTDSSVVEAALRALLRAHHEEQLDRAYADAYTQMPTGESDAWGDLDDFLDAAGRA